MYFERDNTPGTLDLIVALFCIYWFVICHWAMIATIKMSRHTKALVTSSTATILLLQRQVHVLETRLANQEAASVPPSYPKSAINFA